jgi:hypothetical protein
MMNLKPTLNFFGLSWLLFCNFCFGGEAACDSLKARVSASSELPTLEKKRLLTDIEGLIFRDEKCAKNILGRLYYSGTLLPKDVSKAHQIFYELSQQSYPPAMYNLAYLSMKEGTESPENIVNFLHGLMVNFVGDREWGYISAGARDLAGDYLDELRATKNPLQNLSELRNSHTKLATDTTMYLASVVQNRTNEFRSQSDTIASMLMVGMSAYAVGQKISLANRPIQFQSSPFAPRFYTVVPTGSPNILYLIPR